MKKGGAKMQDSRISFNIRIAAGIMATMILIVMLFCSYYIASESGHKCIGNTDEECPVCACIRQCKSVIHHVSDGVVTIVAIILPIIYFILTELPDADISHEQTLISQKIRLNI